MCNRMNEMTVNEKTAIANYIIVVADNVTPKISICKHKF
jgi:hypothetical protein